MRFMTFSALSEPNNVFGTYNKKAGIFLWFSLDTYRSVNRAIYGCRTYLVLFTKHPYLVLFTLVGRKWRHLRYDRRYANINIDLLPFKAILQLPYLRN